MIEFLIYIAKMLLMTLPFILFALLNAKANLKKPERSRQFLMPIVAVVYSIVVLILLSHICNWLVALINLIPDKLAAMAASFEGGALSVLAGPLKMLAAALKAILKKLNLTFWVCFVANAAIMLVFITLKKFFLAIFRRACKPGTGIHDTLGGIFYETDDEIKQWYVKPHFGQGRTFLKTFYIASIIISVIALLISGQMFKQDMLAVPFYPVFGIMILGEVYFFLCGLTRSEMKSEITGEDDEAATVSNYSLLRKMLRKLFGDKLTAEDTAATNAASDMQTIEELLDELEHGNGAEEAYGRYMRLRSEAGFELERNYLMSGLDLLRGKSILFNNPFYYDLIPYAFYPMNRTLLRHKKVLIVLGRHGMEEDIAVWCEEGLRAITNVPELWNIGVLGEDEAKDLDIGIVTRSSVHDLKLHEANEEFFERVEFVVLIEPSRLITTAQIGLNSLVRHCRRGSSNKQITFCSTDKNCDGLVDALSHILMTSISEVAATNRHQGVCSYMCWETDREHLQHRMLPNLSRYLGVGTELSFAALKNQVKETDWYGGDAFPVVDMHWIVKQYYYDLLHYAGLPISQKTIEEQFKVSPNLWNAEVRENRYLTVEDEACNMFEVKRTFSTRATNQSFINVISPEYLLKDYMAENDSIFNADPKAIPYIVADYARTARNVVMRLCLRMSTGMVSESELCRELMLIDADTEHPWESFWHQVCTVNSPVGVLMHNKEGLEVLVRQVGNREMVFTAETISRKRKFSMKTGRMETLYFIQDNYFKRALLSELQNAGYIAEDENGERRYLGTELRGQIFQKYLPGQFFTFNGKYYEMLTVASDGQVLVRRAADHITGRPSYRQVRNYVISGAVDSAAMGDSREVAGLRIVKQFADFRVETPAYWQLDRYNDFAGGRKVTINGIPDRAYYNKQILRIDLPEGTDEAVARTLTQLFNEVLRTVFAENHDYIAAVMAGDMEDPMTYSLCGNGGFEPRSGSIYIIEDSQLDLGLLIAAERNLGRIFSIICDYLDWHADAIERSLNPPPEPEVPDYTVPEEEQEPEEKEPKTWIGRVLRKIRNFFRAIGRFFKKIGKAIGGFFGKLFKRKKKDPVEETPEEPAEGTETPIEGEEVPIEGEETPVEGEETSADEAPAEESEPSDEEAPEAAEETEETEETEESEETEETAEAEETEETEESEETDEDPQPMMSLFSALDGIPDLDPAEADLPDPEIETEVIEPQSEGENDEGTPNDANDTIEFEPESVQKPVKPMERKPYHERHYLLYGGKEVPAQFSLAETYAFLKEHGFADGALKQARAGKEIADLIEKSFVPNKPGSHYCDFCGVELMGTEYEVLADGRERCTTCGKTAVKSAAEFEQIYRTIARNMEAFYGVRITAPVRVQMVNAKKLHKRLGKRFIPTGQFDGRILGVAIKDRSGYSILVENGAPRLSSIMTIAHELTHIWQYLHWDARGIQRKYGKAQELEIYEGMAKWAEIQYAYLIGEPAAAKREEISARVREDEYGRGFRKYVVKYPLSTGTHLENGTPFDRPDTPL